MNKHIIAWDLGATKCAAGWVEYHAETNDFICQRTSTVKLADTHSLDDLIQRIETQLGVRMRDADAVSIGAAGQYADGVLNLEKAYPYPMTFANASKQHGWQRFTVIHDYASIVCATFTSYMQQASNIKRLNQAPMQNNGRRVAFGIGTGLGLKDGVLFPNGDFWLGKNEIGHIGITVPPHASEQHQHRHVELMRFLRSLGQESVTFETILSGAGTVRLYHFFHPGKNKITPEEVGSKMRVGLTPELLDTFAWYIGLFVGTVQLSFMPEGGVWMTGGVALHHLDVFDRPAFFAGIHASPAYQTQRLDYPLGVLCNPEHALIGSAYYAQKRLF